MARRLILTNTISLIILGVLLLFSFVPVVMMLSMSLKDSLVIFGDFWAPPIPPLWSNYSTALVTLLPPMLRTLTICAVSIVGITVFSCLASYAFARLKFFGKEALFFLVVFLFLVPGSLTLTPSFVLFDQLHLRNSIIGLIISYVAGGQVFAIFLLSAFFQSQPEEIFEAARIDGASELRMLRDIAIPLAWPILITLGILNFLSIYNDFIWPLLMISSPDLQTLTVALAAFNPANQRLPGRPELGIITAAYVFASVPVLAVFSFGMRYYIEGLTSGAIKS